MNRPVANVLAHVHKEELELLGRPAEGAGEEGGAEGVEAVEQVLLRPHAELLVLLVARPRVHGPLVDALGDVDEAGRLHLLLVQLGAVGRAAVGGGRVVEQLGPLVQGRVLGQGAVVAGCLDVDVGQLDPAARVQVLERVLHELGPVGERADQHAAVDEVELVRVRPRLLEVVDVEGYIGRGAV